MADMHQCIMFACACICGSCMVRPFPDSAVDRRCMRGICIASGNDCEVHDIKLGKHIVYWNLSDDLHTPVDKSRQA
jgi:hypothetical protein